MFERVHSYVKRTLFPFVRIGIFWEDKPYAILVGLNKDSAIMLNSYCLGGENHKKQCWRRRALGGLAATALAARFAQSGLTGGRHADR